MIRTTLARCNAFILQKNYLIGEKAAGLVAMAEALAGLPAEPPATPFLAAFVRLQHFSAAALLAELQPTGQLINGELMRTTPYAVSKNRFLAWHAATARQRAQAYNAEFRLWGIDSNDEIEQLGQRILSILGDRPATAASITAQLPSQAVRQLSQTSRGGRVSRSSNVALALRWLAAQGHLAVHNPVAGRGEETLSYTHFEAQYPDIDLSTAPPEAEAQTALVRAYLAAFGPATEADISFWTGFGKSETARAIAALSDETALAMVEGLPGMLLALKSQADALAAVELPAEPMIHVLPANDPFVTAHRASRSRYFSNQKWQRQVYDSRGAARPTILVNGQVAGLWRWSSDNSCGRLSRELLADIDGPLAARIEAELTRMEPFISSEIRPRPIST